MKREERAAQLWSLLVLAARNRQTLTYGIVGKAIGAPTAALGAWLDPIRVYCERNALPPLTVLVVSDSSGLPGSGLTNSDPVPQLQQKVFNYDWLASQAPQPDDFL